MQQASKQLAIRSEGMNGAPEAMTDWSRHAAAAAVVEAPALHADCICIPLHPCVPLQVYGPTAVNVHHLLEALRGVTEGPEKAMVGGPGVRV